MKILNFFIASCFVGLVGCASGNEYREAKSSRSSGYTQTQLEKDRYLVEYKTNTDDLAKTRALGLRRAAELTLENGFDTFEIVSQNSEKETDRDRVGFSQPSETVVARQCGLLTCSTQVHTRPGFGTETEVERNSVVVSLEIVMSNKDASVSTSLYDASEVFSSIGN